MWTTFCNIWIISLLFSCTVDYDLYVHVFVCVHMFKLDICLCEESCVHIYMDGQKLTSGVHLLSLFIFILWQHFSLISIFPDRQTWLVIGSIDLPIRVVHSGTCHVIIIPTFCYVDLGIMPKSLCSWKTWEKEKWSEKSNSRDLYSCPSPETRNDLVLIRDKKFKKEFWVLYPGMTSC